MHIASRLYLEAFDFPASSIDANRQLMIAATPRSGSTAFCLELWRSGLLGAPLEYGNFKLVSRIPRWSVELADKVEYWRKIKRVRTSPNGVFSYKFFIANYREISATEPRLLESITSTHVIYLTRRDVLAQAISYSKACRTGQWFGSADSELSLELDRDDVRKRYLSLKQQMLTWETLFELTDSEVLRVSYEDYLENPSETVSRSIEHVLSQSMRLQPLSIPPLIVQRNSESERWLAELRDDEHEWGTTEGG